MDPIAPCVFISKSQVRETLATPVSEGKRLLEPLKTFAKEMQLPVNILEDHKTSNEAEVHRHEGDLWYCLEGEVEFVAGGELVEPWAKQLPDGKADDRELKAKEIAHGTSYTLQAGDLLWIPPGQPHLHRTKTTARLFIIKIPATAEVPPSKVPGWYRLRPVS